MSGTSVTEKPTEEKILDKEIRAILFLLQGRIDKLKEEVDGSYALHNLGTQTKLTQAIEEMIRNPMDNVYYAAVRIDGQAKSLIDRMVKGFFTMKDDLIASVYTLVDHSVDLYYLVVLRDDTNENRSAINDFYDVYDELELSRKYPVYFQFVPAAVIDEIEGKEEIKIG